MVRFFTSGNEERLKTRLRSLHSNILATGKISIDDLQIERADAHGTETPFATYCCISHGVLRKRVNTLLHPGSLTCDLCALLAKPNKFNSDTLLRSTLQKYVEKRLDLCDRVDLSSMRQLCLRRDNRTALYISYDCRCVDLQGQPHGEQYVKRSEALRLKFPCGKCDCNCLLPTVTAAELSPMPKQDVSEVPPPPFVFRPLYVNTDTTAMNDDEQPSTPLHKTLLVSPCSVTNPTPAGVRYDAVKTPQRLVFGAHRIHVVQPNGHTAFGAQLERPTYKPAPQPEAEPEPQPVFGGASCLDDVEREGAMEPCGVDYDFLSCLSPCAAGTGLFWNGNWN